MSVKVMSYVWDHSQQTGTHLLMMLAIADHANDAGECWPMLTRLAQKCRVSVRQAQYLIKALEDAGELRIERGTGRGHASIYTVKGAPECTLYPKGAADCTFQAERVQQGAPITPERVQQGAPITQRKGAIQRHKRVQSSAPALMNARAVLREPSLEPSRKQEEKRENRPRAFPADPGEQDRLKATVLTPRLTAWCATKGLTYNLDDEWEAFTRKALAKAYTYADWYSAFQNWLTSPYQPVPKKKSVKDDYGFLKYVTPEGVPR